MFMFEHHYTQIPSEVKYKNQSLPIPVFCAPTLLRGQAPGPGSSRCRPKGMLPATSHVVEYVDHPRKPRQLACKAAAQLRRVFITLADIEKAAAAVYGDV